MQMFAWVVLNCLLSACAHRTTETSESKSWRNNHTCSIDDLGVKVGNQCTTFRGSTGLGTEWVAPLACVAKSFRVLGVTDGCHVRPHMHTNKCETILKDAGLALADAEDLELDTLRQVGMEFVIGDGLHAAVYWTSDSTRDTENIDLGAVIAFRWQESDQIDEEQAYYWFAKPGGRFLAGVWLPNFIAQKVTGARDHAWVSSAADLVKAVQAVRPGKSIAFTGFSVGAVCAQLMSILHSQDGLVHPAVVFGGNGVRHVLGLEGGSGPFTALHGRHLKETKRAFHPYIYNFVDPGDQVPRIDCQLGAVCALPESVAGASCTKDSAGLKVSSEQSKSDACGQCETHLSFFLEDKFLDAFRAKGAGAYSCVAGHEWRGAPSFCFNKDPKVVSIG
eukprot:TRINITY_DN29553_c0_g2_i1.p1 TRINITY_DN29553_c0_g2~~TRINITY_DN29553_c0_g2_i1.p1  ORF type:complete len:391 (+),score=52.41 TRINITY_DN29553_c0_g2_i1:42-1214(+)